MRSILAGGALGGAVLLGPILPVGAEASGVPSVETACPGDSDSVVRLYTAGLGRAPDAVGFDFWMTEYTSGRWSFPDMAQFFVESPEFVSAYGSLDQDGFVRRLYRNVLARDAEAEGLNYWNWQMAAGLSRAAVLMRFAESPENIERTGTHSPTLGAFNEGRPEGPWRCGPDVSPALLRARDLPSGWIEIAQPGRAPARSGCRSALRMPGEIDSTLFRRDVDFGAVIGHGLSAYPTRLGADAYMAQVRGAVSNCALFLDGDWTISYAALDFPSHGAETVAVRIVQTSPNGTWRWVVDFVVVRVGTVISAVDHTDLFTVDSDETEHYVALATERLESFTRG